MCQQIVPGATIQDDRSRAHTKANRGDTLACFGTNKTNVKVLRTGRERSTLYLEDKFTSVHENDPLIPITWIALVELAKSCRVNVSSRSCRVNRSFGASEEGALNRSVRNA